MAQIRTKAPQTTEPATEVQQEIRPDICVIGAGAGGLTAAAAAAAFGSHVVLIEKGRIGGETLYGGSLPAQALIAAAERAHAVRTASRFGVKTVRFGVDFRKRARARAGGHRRGRAARFAANVSPAWACGSSRASRVSPTGRPLRSTASP